MEAETQLSTHYRYMTWEINAFLIIECEQTVEH